MEWQLQLVKNRVSNIFVGNFEMDPIIRINDVVQEMDGLSDEYRVFFNIRTGEFVLLSDDDLSAAEEGDDLEGLHEWQQEIIRKAGEVISTDDYRELPSQFDIHEYAGILAIQLYSICFIFFHCGF